MCGRFYYEIDRDLFESIEIGELLETDALEIFPANRYPILARMGSRKALSYMNWGFPLQKSSGKNPALIINARAEGLEDKRTFHSPFLTGRCIVPMSGFYEWTKSKPKHKYAFFKDNSLLYTAAISAEYDGEKRFCIVTTAANDSISAIHDRMPLILSDTEKDAWLDDISAARAFLDSPPSRFAGLSRKEA